jgi:hypothetical protein
MAPKLYPFSESLFSFASTVDVNSSANQRKGTNQRNSRRNEDIYYQRVHDS